MQVPSRWSRWPPPASWSSDLREDPQVPDTWSSRTIESTGAMSGMMMWRSRCHRWRRRSLPPRAPRRETCVSPATMDRATNGTLVQTTMTAATVKNDSGSRASCGPGRRRRAARGASWSEPGADRRSRSRPSSTRRRAWPRRGRATWRMSRRGDGAHQQGEPAADGDRGQRQTRQKAIERATTVQTAESVTIAV